MPWKGKYIINVKYKKKLNINKVNSESQWNLMYLFFKYVFLQIEIFAIDF